MKGKPSPSGRAFLFAFLFLLHLLHHRQPHLDRRLQLLDILLDLLHLLCRQPQLVSQDPVVAELQQLLDVGLDLVGEVGAFGGLHLRSGAQPRYRLGFFYALRSRKRVCSGEDRRDPLDYVCLLIFPVSSQAIDRAILPGG